MMSNLHDKFTYSATQNWNNERSENLEQVIINHEYLYGASLKMTYLIFFTDLKTVSHFKVSTDVCTI